MKASSILFEETFSGEIITGSPEEKIVVEKIRGVMEDAGADEVIVTPVNVLYWRDVDCFIEVGGYKIKCYANPYTLSDDVLSRIVFGNYYGDNIIFQENPRDKIVVIPYTDDPDDIYFAIHKLLSLHVKGVILYDELPGRYRRIVVTGVNGFPFSYGSPLPIPVVSIRKEDYLKIIKSMKKEARIYVKSLVRDSIGYNVSALLYGRVDDEVHITAHHDHWFSGFSDNRLGVETLINILKYLVDRKNLRYTYKIISFTAEESGAPGYSGWYWIWGSRKYLEEARIRGRLDNVLLNVNIDSIVTKPLRISYTPLIHRLVNDFLDKENIEYRSLGLNEPIFDSFSYILNGVPAVTFHTHEELRPNYHTNLDDGKEASPQIDKYVAQILVKFIEFIDSRPYGKIIEPNIGFFIEKEILLPKESWPLELRILVKKLSEIDRIIGLIDLRCFVKKVIKHFLDPVANYRIGGCFSVKIAPELLVANDIAFLEYNKLHECLGERIEPGEERALPSISSSVSEYIGYSQSYKDGVLKSLYYILSSLSSKLITRFNDIVGSCGKQ